MDKKQPQKYHVNTSGWEPAEKKALAELVKAEGTDVSKYIRKLVRQAAAAKEQNKEAK